MLELVRMPRKKKKKILIACDRTRMIAGLDSSYEMGAGYWGSAIAVMEVP